jgi:predicted RecA/RadA family phage recombinase
MAKIFVQLGDVLTIPAPATVASGALVVAGAIIGVAAGDAASGDPVDVETRGVWKLPKVSDQTCAIGDVLYWDAGDGLVTDDSESGANPRIGVAVAPGGDGAARVLVKLG